MITFYGRIWMKDEGGNILSHETPLILIDEQNKDACRKARKEVDDLLQACMPDYVDCRVRYFYNEWPGARW